MRELVRDYPVDGLHLDFIRYPGPSFDYSRAALEGFRRRAGAATSSAGPRAARRRGTTTGARCSPRSRRASPTPRARERPGLVLSAAVAPDEAQAVNHKFQDWPRWLASGRPRRRCAR